MAWRTNSFVEAAEHSWLAHGCIGDGKIGAVLEVLELIERHDLYRPELAGWLRAARAYRNDEFRASTATTATASSIGSLGSFSSADSTRPSSFASAITNYSEHLAPPQLKYDHARGRQHPLPPVPPLPESNVGSPRPTPTSRPRSHSRLGRKETTKYYCPSCDATTTRSNGLWKHMSGQCESSTCWTCPSCPTFLTLKPKDAWKHCKDAHHTASPAPEAREIRLPSKQVFGCLHCETCLPSLEEFHAHIVDHFKLNPTIVDHGDPSRRVRALLQQPSVLLAVIEECKARGHNLEAWKTITLAKPDAQFYWNKLEHGHKDPEAAFHYLGYQDLKQLIRELFDTAGMEYLLPQSPANSARTTGPAQAAPGIDASPTTPITMSPLFDVSHANHYRHLSIASPRHSYQDVPLTLAGHPEEAVETEKRGSVVWTHAVPDRTPTAQPRAEGKRPLSYASQAHPDAAVRSRKSPAMPSSPTLPSLPPPPLPTMPALPEHQGHASWSLVEDPAPWSEPGPFTFPNIFNVTNEFSVPQKLDTIDEDKVQGHSFMELDDTDQTLDELAMATRQALHSFDLDDWLTGPPATNGGWI